jgi:ABC-2 type transport system permease protein
MIDLGLFRDTLASEWTKLRSVRSTYWSILAAIVLGIGLGAAISAGSAHAYSHMSLQSKLTFDPTSNSLAGFFFAQLALGVFAIMTISSEYSTGTIRTTLSAVPQRGYVLAAKSALVGLVSLAVGLVIAFPSFWIGQLIFRGHHLDVPLSDPGVLRAVLGSALYVAALALFSLGLGTVIRHTAGAITGLTAIAFIIPIFSNLLPDTWQNDLSRYFPANAGGAITTVVASPHTLSPWEGYGVFLIWVAALLGAGWYVLRQRDV